MGISNGSSLDYCLIILAFSFILGAADSNSIESFTPIKFYLDVVQFYSFLLYDQRNTLFLSEM